MDKLLLIDGNSIMNRAFYGLPLLSDSKGRYTNAVFGFVNILFSVIDEEQPDRIMIAFDRKEPTFRHQMFEQYKGNRKGMPDELRQQMPLIKEVLTTMQIPIYEQAGIEADDIIGTLSRMHEPQGQVVILSGDRDLLQLASQQTKVSIPKTKGGKTITEHYYEEDFIRTYGFRPLQFIDVKGMMGDSSDNIPGIPGIGEKTAHKFIQQYGSLEGLYRQIEDLTGKTREKVEANKELAFLSKELATIKRDCDLELSDVRFEWDKALNDDTFELFKQLNFNRLLNRFQTSHRSDSEESKLNYQVCDSMESLLEWLDKHSDCKKLAFFYQIESDYLGIALSCSNRKQMESCLLEQREQPISVKFDRLFEKLGQFDKLLFYDYKSFLHRFEPERLDLLRTKIEDLLIMYYLLKPNKAEYPLADLGLSHTEYHLETIDHLLGKGKKKQSFSALPTKSRQDFLIKSSRIIEQSFSALQEQLIQEEMLGLYNTLEKPLIEVLYCMEKTGIGVDKEILSHLSQELEKEIGIVEQQIYEQAGEEFNIKSPKQLGVVLFEKMGLPALKKTKTGYSTNAEVLERLLDKHPIIEQILDYRFLTKLKSTYADGLFPYVQADGKIHTSFNQTIASTGRLSSTEPNLQNIPIRQEQGRLIRKAFVPAPGNVFIDADYSQIELRVLAHLSEDEAYLEAYRQNLDIHTMTAARVFHVSFEEVTPLMRRNAKAVNFGVVYGISDFGLSRDLKIPVKEAKAYIDSYFEKYYKVKAFLDITVAKAQADGYVTTMYNRKRFIPELSSGNYMTRQFGERIAMNTPIQGSAADIIKLAMIKVYKRLNKEQLKAKLILQVHDELIIEAPKSEQKIVLQLLQEEMEQAVQLSVPLTVDISTAENWYYAK